MAETSLMSSIDPVKVPPFSEGRWGKGGGEEGGLPEKMAACWLPAICLPVPLPPCREHPRF